MTPLIKYLAGYPEHLQASILSLWESGKLKDYLNNRYPTLHQITNDNALRELVMDYKNRFLKKSAPISKVVFDSKIHVLNNALGTHRYVSRVQGSKLKSKNEIRVSTLFKNVPVEFMDMIVVHELAHVKEKEHNKAFYQLCRYMLNDYHQIEFDVRVYLFYLDSNGQTPFG